MPSETFRKTLDVYDQELAKAEERLDTAYAGVDRIITASIFNGEEPTVYPIYEKENWRWDIPNDGKWHPLPDFDHHIAKIGFDLPERGVRSIHIMFADTAPRIITYSCHSHNDACEIITVSNGVMIFNILTPEGNIERFKLRDGQAAKIAADSAHYVTASKDALFTLLYKKRGSCDFCLHKSNLSHSVLEVPECNA